MEKSSYWTKLFRKEEKLYAALWGEDDNSREQAFNAMFEMTYQELLTKVRKKLKSYPAIAMEWAEDICQDAYVRYEQKLSNELLRPELIGKKPIAWLVLTADYLIKERSRDKFVQNTTPVDTPEIGRHDYEEENNDNDERISRELLGIEDLTQHEYLVAQIMEHLKKHERQKCLQLFEYLFFSYSELDTPYSQAQLAELMQTTSAYIKTLKKRCSDYIKEVFTQNS